MKNFIIKIPATIDLEVQAECEHDLLPAIKETLADFYYAINVDVNNYQIDNSWGIKDKK